MILNCRYCGEDHGDECPVIADVYKLGFKEGAEAMRLLAAEVCREAHHAELAVKINQIGNPKERP